MHSSIQFYADSFETLHSFMLIPLKLYRCLGHGLKMCILFRYNPQIFYHFFNKMNLVIFVAKVNRCKLSCVIGCFMIIAHIFKYKHKVAGKYIL